jgi:hypothetical protein
VPPRMIQPMTRFDYLGRNGMGEIRMVGFPP